MRTAIVSILVLGIFHGQYAFAINSPNDYDPAETRCHWADDDMIVRLLGRVDSGDQALPNIPPEEQRYLETEYAAAGRVFKEEEANRDNSHARSTKMYMGLYSRPLYAVWEFRKTIEPTRSALKRVLKQQTNFEKGDRDINTYRKNPEAEKLERASRAVYAVGNYVRDLQKFLTRIEGREFSLVTMPQYQGFVADLYSMNLNMGEFISCKLAKVMGRQSFDLN